MSMILTAVVVLGTTGIVLSLILYFTAKKFKVEEDPRIDEIQETLPGANCGACGYPGCRGFAEACSKSASLDKMLCPVGGSAVMKKIGDIMGMKTAETEPKVAVLRCNGSCAFRPATNHYDSAASCRISSILYGGHTACAYGCVGLGDCVSVCKFGALSMDKESGLPVVDEEKCTSCGACVNACPKGLFELRKKGLKSRKIYVACRNKDKGPQTKKACSVGCIACSKCVKVCEFNAITIENNVAYIDFNACRMCRKCVEECPTGAILEKNFPPRKPKQEESVKEN